MSEPIASLCILIVVYRPELAEIRAGLQAIRQAHRQGLPVTVRLWHNDTGPEETPRLSVLVEQLQAEGLPLHVLGMQGNLGFGRAINTALPGIGQDAILLLNQDAIPEPGSLEHLWGTATRDDSAVAAWEMRQIPYEHPKDYDPFTGETGWCSGAAVMFRASALRHVGGFEPRFFMYCEDVDLSWRLRAAGWRLRYLPRSAVVHRTYAYPGETKQLAALQGRFANLCLRARFAGRRQVIDGFHQVAQELKRQEPFPGFRRGLLQALVRAVRHYPYFRRSRCAGTDFEPCFNGWDYERRREGSFHPFKAQAEQAGPLPSVTVVLRASPDPDTLHERLACIANQTHAVLEVLVVGGTVHGPSDLGERWTPRLDLRILPPTTGSLEQVATVHATADWCLTLETDRLMPYADHVEVLLQAALDAKATGAVAQTWAVQARQSDRRQAHRHHWPRRLLSEGQVAAGTRLLHRSVWKAPDTARCISVAKVTAIEYEAPNPPEAAGSSP